MYLVYVPLFMHLCLCTFVYVPLFMYLCLCTFVYVLLFMYSILPDLLHIGWLVGSRVNHRVVVKTVVMGGS